MRAHASPRVSYPSTTSGPSADAYLRWSNYRRAIGRRSFAESSFFCQPRSFLIVNYAGCRSLKVVQPTADAIFFFRCSGLWRATAVERMVERNAPEARTHRSPSSAASELRSLLRFLQLAVQLLHLRRRPYGMRLFPGRFRSTSVVGAAPFSSRSFDSHAPIARLIRRIAGRSTH
jgi:hypothetical protein